VQGRQWVVLLRETLGRATGDHAGVGGSTRRCRPRHGAGDVERVRVGHADAAGDLQFVRPGALLGDVDLVVEADEVPGLGRLGVETETVLLSYRYIADRPSGWRLGLRSAALEGDGDRLCVRRIMEVDVTSLEPPLSGHHGGRVERRGHVDRAGGRRSSCTCAGRCARIDCVCRRMRRVVEPTRDGAVRSADRGVNGAPVIVIMGWCTRNVCRSAPRRP